MTTRTKKIAQITEHNLDAQMFGAGWLIASECYAKDTARPALDHVVSIEMHEGGVQLVATDSTILARVWVPRFDDPFSPPPPREYEPIVMAHAQDSNGRGRGLCAYLVNEGKKADEDAPPFSARVALGEAVLDQNVGAKTPSFEGIERKGVTIDAAEQERLVVPCYEGAWPTWRGLYDQVKPKAVPAISFSESMATRIGKIAARLDAAPRFAFSGDLGPVVVTFGAAALPVVELLVMPLRIID